MKFVVAPDSYKGSLTSLQVGETIVRALQDEIANCEVAVIPMADGGEGTVDAIVRANGGRFVHIQATGPLGNKVHTYYGLIEDDGGRPTAVIEAASIFGLPMVPPQLRNPMNTTSRGMGEAIRDALDQGVRRFLIGLGGSSTNDGGLGLLVALGGQFRLTDGSLAEGFGRELAMLVEADLNDLDPRLLDCQFTIASDVTNPLLGPEGATYIFGPQKGATTDQIQELDQALADYADMLESAMVLRLRDHPGAGAAGGLGFAFLLVGGEMTSGAQVVANAAHLPDHIKEADWVITGEGRSDEQTLYGKLPFYVAKLARQAGIDTILISGSLEEARDRLRDVFAGCFSIVPGPASLEECMSQAEHYLYETTRDVARLLLHKARQ